MFIWRYDGSYSDVYLIKISRFDSRKTREAEAGGLYNYTKRAFTDKKLNYQSETESMEEIEWKALYQIWCSSFMRVFHTGPAQSAILTDREVVSLFLHFTVNPKPRVEFIDRPRCCLRGKECSITRFGQVESRWGYSGTSDRIRWERRPRVPSCR